MHQFYYILQRSGMLLSLFLLLQACGGGGNAGETVSGSDSTEVYESEMGAPEFGVCVWDKASIRAEDTKDGKYISSLSLGETVTLTGETTTDASDNDREYLKVRLSDGTEGWVSSYLIARDAVPAGVEKKSTVYKRPDLLTATDKAFEPLEFVAIVSYGEDNWVEVVGSKRLKSGWIKGSGLTQQDDNIALITLYTKAMEIEDQAKQQEAIKEIVGMSEFEYNPLMPLLRGNVDPFKTQETVEVSSMAELLNAIQPYTKVIIKPGTYNISAFQNEMEELGADYYDESQEQYAFLEEGGIAIRQVNNLILEGAGEGKTHLVTENGWIPVITLESCEKVGLQGLRLGHDVEKGYCSGSVLSLNSCNEVTSQNNILYGSGTMGYEIYESNDFVSSNNEILECTEGILYLSGGRNFKFTGDRFHDNESYSEFISLASMDNVKFSGCTFERNKGEQETQNFFYLYDSEGLYMEDCSFNRNTATTFVDVSDESRWSMGSNSFSDNGWADVYDGDVDGGDI